MFEQILAAHEPELRVGADRDLVDDLLELHAMSAEFMGGGDLFINVMGPFLLGLDTVASSSAFLLYAILKDPDLTARVRAEADALFADGLPAPEGLQAMDTTRRAMLETLRMYPIAPVLFRTATNSFDFGGYHVPAGTLLLMALSVTHYLEEFFPDPERFDVDRLLPERAEGSRPGVFAPFGLGPPAWGRDWRSCRWCSTGDAAAPGGPGAGPVRLPAEDRPLADAEAGAQLQGSVAPAESGMTEPRGERALPGTTTWTPCAAWR